MCELLALEDAFDFALCYSCDYLIMLQVQKQIYNILV